MNSVILSGRLTAAPEIRYTTGAEPIAIASYTLAVQRDFKNNEGNYDADFIRCTAFGKRAEFAEKYLKKGMKILVEGRLQTGSYEKDGVKHFTTDLMVNKHEFCESRSAAAATESTAPAASGVPAGFQAVEDDDIPF